MLAVYFAFGMLFTVLYLVALVFCLIWNGRRRRVREEASRNTTQLLKVGDKANLINHSLIIHVWTEESNVDLEKGCSSKISNEEDQMEQCVIDGKHNDNHLISPDKYIESSVDSVEEQNDDGVCAICLASYQKGDIYGQSCNPSCRHVFHRDCIVGWLMARDDCSCPCCRQPYLTACSTSLPK